MKNILFMGNHNIGYETLKILLEKEVEITGVFSNPDISSSAVDQWHLSVKELASRHNLKFYQLETLKTKNSYDLIKGLSPNIILSVGYGLIIPKKILSIPSLTSINLHGSLLPDYRGRFCPVWALINGERKTGATLHVIDEGIDTGPIIAQVAFDIYDNDTAFSLYWRLVAHSIELFRNSIDSILAGNIRPLPQAKTGRYFSILKEEQRKINWSNPSQDIYNLIRACFFPPYPCSHTMLNGHKFHILRAEISEMSASGAAPGTVIAIDKKGCPLISTADRAMTIIESELVHPYINLGDRLT